MHLLRTILAAAWLWGVTCIMFGATSEKLSAASPAQAVAGGAAASSEHGLPPRAVEIGRIGAFPITNSMVLSWLVAAALIVCAQMSTKRMKEIPSGAQNFWEWLVESLYEFLEGIIGQDLVKKTFWFFATLFMFILFSNWVGLIPGVGTIGWGVRGDHGFHVAEPWFRGVNADLNMTLAMAMIFFVCWTLWALQANGAVGFVKHLFAPKGETTGALKMLMILVFIAVGFLEIVSILFRPVSLSFRLYGNIFAGETMLESMANVVKEPAWARILASFMVPIPFYFMELLVGLVQALVFMLLTAVFTLLICQHEEGDEPAHP
ncbi:MAG: F0F1 ATP synthase subunit A [Chloroflexi bacterium]|nr:F0F1 ATP synthase subunit A [Chloroflexota bacterium]